MAVVSAIAEDMKDATQQVASLVSAPFVGSIDLVQLFLLTGCVIVFAAVWFTILHHMARIAAETI
jgi:hypothetical protein